MTKTIESWGTFFLELFVPLNDNSISYNLHPLVLRMANKPQVKTKRVRAKDAVNVRRTKIGKIPVLTNPSATGWDVVGVLPDGREAGITKADEHIILVRKLDIQKYFTIKMEWANGQSALDISNRHKTTRGMRKRTCETYISAINAAMKNDFKK